MKAKNLRISAPSLRTAHRALTRARICEAAQELFFTRSFDQTTMDEIAQEAGVSRSTLYVHFSDKDEILSQISVEYASALCEINERLPGPRPSRAEIGLWIEGLAGFIAEERVPTILISNLADRSESLPSIKAIGERLVAGLAARLPGFGKALADPACCHLAHAWALVVMRELGWACLQSARDPVAGGALLIVVGDIFHRFVETYSEENPK